MVIWAPRWSPGTPRRATRLEPDELAQDLGLGAVADAFDVLVGGPPCQAYARVGRAKLREIAEHPKAFKVDPRGNLYLRYLHYVKAAQPLAIDNTAAHSSFERVCICLRTTS